MPGRPRRSIWDWAEENVEEEAIPQIDEDELEHDFNSSHLSSATYDVASRTMTITFHNGQTYVWPGMDQSTYNALISAGSAGGYFWEEIRGR